jgi:hypothetical protein
MKLYRFLFFAVVLSMLLFHSGSAQAGAKLKIDDESSIDLGVRLQTQFFMTDKDLDGDGRFKQVSDFKVRRARIRLNAKITDKMSAFLQTEFAEEAGEPGADMRIIDAYTNLKFDDWFQLITGENMAPASRENVTSSGALLAIDRPGVAYKALTWGGGTRAAFTNESSLVSDANAGFTGKVDIRDLGATLFGTGSISDVLHAKYYLGVYDGVQGESVHGDAKRTTGRVQVNIGDAEAGYYDSATYLGKKSTIGIGASYDRQSNVDTDLATGNRVDYLLYSADIFFDRPIGVGALTLEGAYSKLDLDDAGTLTDAGGNGRQAQGTGYYVQAGCLINKIQPWAAYETWDSDGANNVGDYALYRVGASYYLKGHNANIKAGYERFKARWNLTSGNEDTINTYLLGFYVTY